MEYWKKKIYQFIFFKKNNNQNLNLYLLIKYKKKRINNNE